MSTFTSMARMVEHDFHTAIGGLPRFRCHLRMDIPPRMLVGSKRSWIAIASLAGPIRRHFCAIHGLHNPIIFDEHFLPEKLSQEWVEAVILHELAHFLAEDIDPKAPDHGHLWARCFTMLGLIVGLDQLELMEASDHIAIYKGSALKQQLSKDRCENVSSWQKAWLQHSAEIHHSFEQRSRDKFHYQEIQRICARAPA